MRTASSHMTNGPPPTAAESSSPTTKDQDSFVPTVGVQQPAQIPSSQPYYSPAIPYPSAASASPTSNQPYYNYNAWQGGWPTTYPYSASGSIYQPTQQYSQSPYASLQPHSYQKGTYSTPQQPFQSFSYPVTETKPIINTKPPTPPPPPAAKSYRHWDEAFRAFFTLVGFTQALGGFGCDMVVLNPEHEKERVPEALEELVRSLSAILQGKNDQDVTMAETNADDSERSLEERKLDYVHLANGAQPRSQTSINKSVSAFLAQNRARNDASNRAEFLHSLAEKRRRLVEEDPGFNIVALPSCARTDARPIDRDSQMKYDIAKNEEGPLRRTLKHTAPPSSEKGDRKLDESQIALGDSKISSADPEVSVTSARYPGLDDRLANMETHLAVRYVPSPPRTLLSRLKFLEDHIIKLEKEYPPWAALHFNQPGRGWPPPPRATPIIVPPNLRSTEKEPLSTLSTPMSAVVSQNAGTAQAAPAKSRSNKSSLHRAVLEKLEVQQAMSDLAGASGSTGR